ncbi:MAG: LysR family transcriptional regulator [Eggerthellaceae bacterium]|nr:LysR family transcriptional regulator [Eggerthellaceae bacterium]
MRTEVLREFIALAQHLSFSVAARKLNMAQSRLSSHISDLEKEVGFPLVVRSKPISLTHEGEEFLVAASRMLGEMDSVISRCRKSSKRQSSGITLMRHALSDAYPEPSLRRLNEAKRATCAAFPDVRFATVPTVRSLSELDVLRQGESDLCYMLVAKGDAAPPDVVTRECFPTTFTAWVGAGHPLFGRSSVTLEELAEFPVLVPGCLEIASYRQAVESIFSSCDLAPAFFVAVTDTAASFAFVEQEEEVFVMPSFLSAFGIFGSKAIPISDEAAAAHVVTACLASRSDATFEYFWNHLTQ